VCQLNNPVTFSIKPIEPGEFLNQMVEALGITIGGSPKSSPLTNGKRFEASFFGDKKTQRNKFYLGGEGF